jgi:hypothetical protein
MSDQPAYRLEIPGMDDPTDAEASRPTPRRWIGIHFECCGVYSRLYRNRQGTAYEGRCPHCLAPVRILIGPGGTDDRFFRAR